MIDWSIVAGLAVLVVFLARGLPVLSPVNFEAADEQEKRQRRRFEETCEKVRKQAAERNYK